MSEQLPETERSVRVKRGEYHPGLVVRVLLQTWERDSAGEPRPVEPEPIGQFAFAEVSRLTEPRTDQFGRERDRIVDDVRGELPDGVERGVFYIGAGFGKNYYRSHPHEGGDYHTVPVDVLERLDADGWTLVTNVDGGWANWDGRPEWSTTYLNLEDAEAVDTEKIIDKRRDDNR